MKVRKHTFSWESDESQKIFLQYHRPEADQAREEVEHLMAYFSLKPPGRVLDVGCGLGFQLAAFGQFGYSGVGVDISDLIIEEAINHCKDLPQCEIVKMRGSDIHWENEFDLVYSLSVPLGFMNEDELRVHIGKMWAAVKPGGVLLIKVPYLVDLGYDHRPVNKWEFKDGKYTLTDKRISDDNIKHEHCVIIDTVSGEIDEWFEEQRYYGADDILDVLRRYGVEAARELVDHDGRFAKPDDNAHVYFARKGDA